MTRLRSVVLVALAALLLAACGESRTVDDAAPTSTAATATTEYQSLEDGGSPTVATISGLGEEGREIPRSELEEVVSAIEGSDQFVQAVFGGALPPGFRQNVLTQFIQVEVIENLVTENGAEVTDADRQEIRDLLHEQLSQVLTQGGGGADVEEVMDQIDPYAQLLIQRNSLLTALGRKLTEGQQPGSQEVVCARHILVADEARANELLTELQGGADFAALASANSTDTGSGANGGDLECAASSGYVPEFAAAVDAAPLNEVVGPVQTQFGFHLITVYDRRTEPVPVDTMGPAGDAIAQRLQEIEVEVAPDLGSWDTTSFSVVAPGTSTEPPAGNAPPPAEQTPPATGDTAPAEGEAPTTSGESAPAGEGTAPAADSTE